MKKEITRLLIFTFFVTYVFAPIKGWLDTETKYEISKADVEQEVWDIEKEPTLVSEEPTEPVEITKEDIARYILDVFGYGRDGAIALRVAHCESRFNQDAVNVNEDGSEDVGVFQINQKWHADKGDAYDLVENIRIAKEIKDTSGWQAWVCWQKFSYGWNL